MPMIQPYLFFEGRAEEALEFYKKAIGAEVPYLMRFKDAPVPPDPEMCAGGVAPDGQKVMHACLRVGTSEVMVSDGRQPGEKFQGFALTVSVETDDDARVRFAALSEGGTVQMPLAETFFASTFGVCVDKFGLGWMVIKPKPKQ